MNRIGISGFSTGGATSIMAGARYARIKAVIAEGGYYDFHKLIDDESERYWFGGLYAFGARLSYQLALGMPMTVLSPVSVIGQIAPRPVLLVYGTREPSLPGARKQLTVAGENAELWEVPNGTHGSYWIHAPEEYERRVIAFFDSALGVSR
jgi:dipeptidyl aminopeptidase/acylaminoacyl peptidase